MKKRVLKSSCICKAIRLALSSFTSNYDFLSGASALAEVLYSSAKAEAPKDIQNSCIYIKCVLQLIDFQKKASLLNPISL